MQQEHLIVLRIILYYLLYSQDPTGVTIHLFRFALRLWTCFVFYKGHISQKIKPPPIFSKWSDSFEWFPLVIIKYIDMLRHYGIMHYAIMQRTGWFGYHFWLPLRLPHNSNVSVSLWGSAYGYSDNSLNTVTQIIVFNSIS